MAEHVARPSGFRSGCVAHRDGDPLVQHRPQCRLRREISGAGTELSQRLLELFRDEGGSLLLELKAQIKSAVDRIEGLRKIGETVEQEVFAFMTMEPNELTASINHERMPVLLTDPADFETWLLGSTDEAFKLALADKKLQPINSPVSFRMTAYLPIPFSAYCCRTYSITGIISSADCMVFPPKYCITAGLPSSSNIEEASLGTSSRKINRLVSRISDIHF